MSVWDAMHALDMVGGMGVGLHTRCPIEGYRRGVWWCVERGVCCLPPCAVLA